MRIVIDTKVADNVTIGQVKSAVIRSPLSAIKGVAWLLNKGASKLHDATAPKQTANAEEAK